MAFALVQAPNEVSFVSPTTSGQITLTSVTAGSLLICFVGIQTESETVSVADDKGNSWNTAIGPADHSGAQSHRGYIFWARNAIAGTTVITATVTGDPTNARIHAAEFSNATPATVEIDGTPVSNSHISADPWSAGNITTTTTAGLLYGAFWSPGGDIAFTAGANYTTLNTSARSADEYRITTAADTYAVDCDFTSGETGISLGVAFKEVAASGIIQQAMHHYRHNIGA